MRMVPCAWFQLPNLYVFLFSFLQVSREKGWDNGSERVDIGHIVWWTMANSKGGPCPSSHYIIYFPPHHVKPPCWKMSKASSYLFLLGGLLRQQALVKKCCCFLKPFGRWLVFLIVENACWFQNGKLDDGARYLQEYGHAPSQWPTTFFFRISYIFLYLSVESNVSIAPPPAPWTDRAAGVCTAAHVVVFSAASESWDMGKAWESCGKLSVSAIFPLVSTQLFCSCMVFLCLQSFGLQIFHWSTNSKSSELAVCKGFGWFWGFINWRHHFHWRPKLLFPENINSLGVTSRYIPNFCFLRSADPYKKKLDTLKKTVEVL